MLPETPSRSPLDSCSCCVRHTASTLGSRFFILSCSAFAQAMKPRQCSPHLSCAVFKCSLLFKSPTFMTAAATKGWRSSSKELHKSSLRRQLLKRPLAHAQIHATSHDTTCALPPSQSSLIQFPQGLKQWVRNGSGCKAWGATRASPGVPLSAQPRNISALAHQSATLGL